MTGRQERGSGDCDDCEAEALSGDKDVGGIDTENSKDGDVMRGQCWGALMGVLAMVITVL